MPKYEISRDGISQLALFNAIVSRGLGYYGKGEVTYEDALIMIIMGLVEANETLAREILRDEPAPPQAETGEVSDG